MSMKISIAALLSLALAAHGADRLTVRGIEYDHQFLESLGMSANIYEFSIPAGKELWTWIEVYFDHQQQADMSRWLRFPNRTGAAIKQRVQSLCMNADKVSQEKNGKIHWITSWYHHVFDRDPYADMADAGKFEDKLDFPFEDNVAYGLYHISGRKSGKLQEERTDEELDYRKNDLLVLVRFKICDLGKLPDDVVSGAVEPGPKLVVPEIEDEANKF